MAVKPTMRVLGFMSGTSLDAVDMAILETDGETIAGFGPAGERKMSPQTRAVIEAATAAAKGWPRGEPDPRSSSACSAMSTTRAGSAGPEPRTCWPTSANCPTW